MERKEKEEKTKDPEDERVALHTCSSRNEMKKDAIKHTGDRSWKTLVGLQRQHSSNDPKDEASGRRNFRLLVSFPDATCCKEAHAVGDDDAEVDEWRGKAKATLVPCSCAQCRRGMVCDDAASDWGRNGWHSHWTGADDCMYEDAHMMMRDELREDMLLLDMEEQYFSGKLGGGGNFTGKPRIRKRQKARNKTLAEKRKLVRQSKLSPPVVSKRKLSKQGFLFFQE